MRDLVGFEVGLEKVKTDSGGELKGRLAVVRQDNKRILGIVSDRYRLVKHLDILNIVEDVTGGLGLDLKGVFPCKGGAVMFAKYYYKGELGNREVKVGDVVRFGVEMSNSYDCSLPIGARLIADRLKCTNGMTVPESLAEFSVKHYGGLDLDNVREKVHSVLEYVGSAMDRWKRWSDTSVSDEDAKKFVHRMFGMSRKGSAMYKRYVEIREGGTVWDLYNFFTFYASHEMKVRRVENRRMNELSIQNRVAEELEKVGL